LRRAIELYKSSTEDRALGFFVVPIMVDDPGSMQQVFEAFSSEGLRIATIACWYRNRHIVTAKGNKLTNTWEPVFVVYKSDDYVMNRASVMKIKKDRESKSDMFDEDEYLTCLGDHWPIRNDPRDRRFLPAQLVLNCGQLADLKPGDRVLDPIGMPTIKETCQQLGWKYVMDALTATRLPTRRK